jgi:hypothetical protein
MKVKNETTMSNVQRHLTDAELAAAGFTAGDIAQVRKYAGNGTKTAAQRRLWLRYQQLRSKLVREEAALALKEAERRERFVTTVYALDTLAEIPDAAVRERALKLAAIWSVVEPTVAFPGVLCAEDTMAADHRLNWYLDGDALPADLPAMITSNGRLTAECGVGNRYITGRNGYKYATVTVRTALARALRGKELFNYGA